MSNASKKTTRKREPKFSRFSPTISPEYQKILDKHAKSQKRIAKLGSYK